MRHGLVASLLGFLAMTAAACASSNAVPRPFPGGPVAKSKLRPCAPGAPLAPDASLAPGSPGSPAAPTSTDAPIAPGASHLAIALDSERFVHAPNSTGVVRVEALTSAYWGSHYLGARRIPTPGTSN